MFKKAIPVLSTSLLLPSVVLAQNAEICKGAGSCTDTTLASYFKDISNTLIFVAGAIAVIVLIIGGLNYVTSTGDAARIKKAKDTILYAIIGLIIAILAYAIINFVIERL
jgi:hypothetical protein